MRVSDYEYNENVDGNVSQKRGEVLIEEIEMKIKNNSVPLFEILMIGKEEEEHTFLFNYLAEKGIDIRGTNITAEEMNNYTRVSKKGVNYNNLPEVIDPDLQEKLFDQMKDVKEECSKNGTDYSKDKRYIDAKNQIWEGNLRLAKYISLFKSFRDSKIDDEDLFAFGYRGLENAIEKFDPAKGKFSTYAWVAIYRRLEREIARELNIGPSIYIDYKILQAAKESFLEHKRIEPSVEDYMGMLGFSEKKVNDLLNFDKIIYNHDSLEEKVFGTESDIEQAINTMDDSDNYIDYGEDTYINGDGEIRDIMSLNKDNVQDYDAKAVVEKNAELVFLRRKVNEVMETLTPREAEVLRMRFGLRDGSPKTLEEVGYEFKVTRERIRQIEAKALRKLRHPSRSKHLHNL